MMPVLMSKIGAALTFEAPYMPRMENVAVVEFIASYPPYRVGDRAGFSHDYAERLVREGVAKIVVKSAPRVSPEVAAHDARHRAEQLGLMARIPPEPVRR